MLVDRSHIVSLRAVEIWKHHRDHYINVYLPSIREYYFLKWRDNLRKRKHQRQVIRTMGAKQKLRRWRRWTRDRLIREQAAVCWIRSRASSESSDSQVAICQILAKIYQRSKYGKRMWKQWKQGIAIEQQLCVPIAPGPIRFAQSRALQD